MEDRTLASDSERDRTLDRLSAAQAEGRLTLEELQYRLSAALQSRTRGQLQELTADLPVPGPATSDSDEDFHGSEAEGRTHLEPPREQNPTAIAQALHPNGMRSAWTVWAVVSAASLLLWLLVSVGSDANLYPWFLWIAGPWGFALLVHTKHSRGSRHDKGSMAAAGTTCHVPPTGTPVDPRRYQGF